MFAVESALVCNVVGWADHTSSMSAFETALVIRSSIYRYLKQRILLLLVTFSNIMCNVHESWIVCNVYLLSWIDSFFTAKAFVSGSTKHTWYFIRGRFLSRQLIINVSSTYNELFMMHKWEPRFGDITSLSIGFSGFTIFGVPEIIN